MKEDKYSLTKRERDVLDILWESPTALMASEIAKMRDGMTITTVHTVLKNLLRRDFIKVNSFTYSNTVLSRTYRPIVSSLGFELRKFAESIKNIPAGDVSASNYVSTLLGPENDSRQVLKEIEQVEKLLAEKKEQLKQVALLS